MALRLRRVIVFTADLDRLAAFYEQKLGLTPVAREDGWIDYDAGGTSLALHRGKAGPGDGGGPGATKICFHAPDVQKAADELAARGVKLGKVRTFPGLVLCDFKDPDGNVLQLSSRP